jgi:hypothetical protein
MSDVNVRVFEHTGPGVGVWRDAPARISPAGLGTHQANDICAFLANGLLSIGTLAVSGGNAAQFRTTTPAVYTMGGIQLTRAAVDALTFAAAGTINNAQAEGIFFGVWLVQLNAAGAVTTVAPGADQTYASAAAALAALPPPAAGNIALGSIVVGAKENVRWTANTSHLNTGASGGSAVTFTDAAIKTLPTSI